MSTKNNNQQIDDYLMGRLQGEALAAFKSRLDQETDLMKETEIRAAMLEQLNTLGNMRMKERILKIKKEVHQKEQHQFKRRRLFKVLSAAAAIFLVGLITYFWMQQNNIPLNHSQLYATNYEAYSIPFGSRTTGENKTLIDAGAFYQQKKYNDALPLFEQLNTPANEDPRIPFALGICYMESKQYRKATTTFQALADNSANLYHDQARWYSSLAHLSLGDIEAAKKWLQQLANSKNNNFNEKAKEILKKI